MNEEKETKPKTTTRKKSSTTKKKTTTTRKRTTTTKKTTTKTSSSKKTTTPKKTTTTRKTSTTPKKKVTKLEVEPVAQEPKLEETKEVTFEKEVAIPKEEIKNETNFIDEGEPELLTDLFTKDFVEETKEKVRDSNEMADDFLKEFRPNYAKTIILSIFWAVIIIFIVIWGWDLSRVLTENEPQLCLSKTLYEYDDGTIEECKGLGYNIYHYERGKEDKYLFRPFFIKYKIEEK